MIRHTKVAAVVVGILAAMLLFGLIAHAEDGPTISAAGFEDRFVARELPNPVSWGYMVSALADFNGSGRLDYATGVRDGEIYWFENREDGSWRRHVLAEDPITSLGGTAVDVDGDAHVDLVLGRFWYRNPGPPYDRPFTRYEYDSRVGGMHDVVAADVSGNGRKDIVVLDDSYGAFWSREVWPTLPGTARQTSLHRGIGTRTVMRAASGSSTRCLSASAGGCMGSRCGAGSWTSTATAVTIL